MKARGTAPALAKLSGLRRAPLHVFTDRASCAALEIDKLKPSNILVATDLSEASDGVLTYGRALAEGFHARVHLLHVLPEPEVHGWAVDMGALPHLLQRAEEDAAGAAAGRGDGR